MRFVFPVRHVQNMFLWIACTFSDILYYLQALILIAGDIRTTFTPLAGIFNFQINSQSSKGMCLIPGIGIYQRIALEMVITAVLWLWLILTCLARTLFCSSLDHFPWFPNKDLQFKATGWQLFLFSFTSLSSSLMKLVSCRYINEIVEWRLPYAGGVRF